MVGSSDRFVNCLLCWLYEEIQILEPADREHQLLAREEDIRAVD
jgi:hypothetical protein